ncbi:hypothetical protein ACFT0G_06220 [Streptomyces sp. NPDC057020]|uniref:hypothetical protein n=1 Tax=unclassified Streptomyces TaxID=2593676 RepID=UPI00362EE20A
MTQLDGPRAVPELAAPSAGGSEPTGERPPVARIHRPAKTVVATVGLALAEGANIAGVIPPGAPSQLAGGAIAATAVIALARHCIRRNP